MDPYLDRLHILYTNVGGIGEPRVLIMEGKPHAKMRHKSGQGRHYQPPEDKAAEERTAALLRQAYPGRYLSNVAVVCAFVVPDNRTRDGDNMMKHVKDSANTVIYHDDRQVTGECNFTELDRENPRTYILFGPHASTADRTVDLAAKAKRKIASDKRKRERISTGVKTPRRAIRR